MFCVLASRLYAQDKAVLESLSQAFADTFKGRCCIAEEIGSDWKLATDIWNMNK